MVSEYFDSNNKAQTKVPNELFVTLIALLSVCVSVGLLLLLLNEAVNGLRLIFQRMKHGKTTRR